VNRFPAARIFLRMLADSIVKNLEGQDVRLGSLWEDGPAVFVFVRHFG
jgi:hypothetical protein